MSTMVLQESGAIALAKAVFALPIHIALANGNPAQDGQSLAEIVAGTPSNANGVQSEVGRRRATVAYVSPDPAGTISVWDFATQLTRTYSVSATPTRWLWVRATFESTEGVGQPIREVAIFVGGTVDAALPPGQQWFTPDQVTNPGDCYQLARMERVTLDGSRRAEHQTVLPI